MNPTVTLQQIITINDETKNLLVGAKDVVGIYGPNVFTEVSLGDIARVSRLKPAEVLRYTSVFDWSDVGVKKALISSVLPSLRRLFENQPLNTAHEAFQNLCSWVNSPADYVLFDWFGKTQTIANSTDMLCQSVSDFYTLTRFENLSDLQYGRLFERAVVIALAAELTGSHNFTNDFDDFLNKGKMSIYRRKKRHHQDTTPFACLVCDSVRFTSLSLSSITLHYLPYLTLCGHGEREMRVLLVVIGLLWSTGAYAAPPPEGSEDWLIMKDYKAWVERQYTAGGQWCCDISDGRPLRDNELRVKDGHYQVLYSTRHWTHGDDE